MRRKLGGVGFEIGDSVVWARCSSMKQGEVDLFSWKEVAGVVGVAEADGGEGGAFFTEDAGVRATARSVRGRRFP